MFNEKVDQRIRRSAKGGLNEKRYSILTFVVAALLGLTGVAAAAAEKPITLTMGTVIAKDSVEGESSSKFAELVEKKTGGKLVVNVYHGSQLGNQPAIIQGVMAGSIDLMPIWYEHAGTWVKDYKILGFSYVFRDRDHFTKFLASDLHKNMQAQLREKWGVRILVTNWNLLYKVLISKEPIRSLADLRGKKVRVAEINTIMHSWKALDAVPVPTAWAEAYLALRQGLVDAVDVPISLLYVSKLWEVAKYATITDHVQQNQAVMMNEKRFQSLSAEHQRAILDAAREAGDYYTSIGKARTEVEVEKLKKAGVKFIQIELKPWREKSIPAALKLEATGAWGKGLLEEIQRLE